MLHVVDRQLVTDILEQPDGPIFKGQAVQETPVTNELCCVTSQKNKDSFHNAVEA